MTVLITVGIRLTGRDALKAFINGIEAPVTAIIFAFVGYTVGASIGGVIWRMVGVVAGAFGGYCFVVRKILKTAPKTSPPPPGEEGET